MKKRWWLAGLTGAVVVAGLVLAKGHGRAKAAEPAPPFRLGRVQAEDLQVSVREVGVVDPLTKVDIKATVSGRVHCGKRKER